MFTQKIKKAFLSIKKQTSITFVLIILLCGVLFVSHYLYISSSFTYPHEDEHVYLYYGAKAYDLLKNPSVLHIQQVAGLFTDRQPLYPITIALFLFIFGDWNIYFTGMYVNFLYYAISIIALYFLAKEFVKPFPAFLASFIFAFYGFPLYYLHSAYTEPAATAFVTLSLLCLSKSENFTQRKYSFFFALFLFLGSLTRWVVPLFVIGPFLFVILSTVLHAHKRREWKNILLNISIFIFVGVFLPSVMYYIPRFHYFSNYVEVLRHNGASWINTIAGYTPDLANTFSVHSAMYYINVLSQQTVFFFAIFVCGFVLSLIFWKKYHFPFLAFFIPYAIFTFLSVYKKDRFIVPIYPSMALLSVIIFNFIKNKFLYVGLTILIISLGFLNFLGASWAMGPLGHQGLKDIVMPGFVPHPRRIYLTTIIWPPSKDTLRADIIINAIEKDWKNNSHTALLLNTFTIEPQELDNAFASILYYEGKYKRRTKINFQNLRSIQTNDYKELCSRINQADYILINKSPIIDEKAYTTASADTMIEVFNKAFEKNKTLSADAYKEIEDFYSPFYKHTLALYKKIHPLNEENWSSLRDMFISNDSSEYSTITAGCRG